MRLHMDLAFEIGPGGNVETIWILFVCWAREAQRVKLGG